MNDSSSEGDKVGRDNALPTGVPKPDKNALSQSTTAIKAEPVQDINVLLKEHINQRGHARSVTEPKQDNKGRRRGCVLF